MIFSTKNAFNRYGLTALPLVALIALSAGCSSDTNGTNGASGSGGSGATGGSGAGGAGGTSGSGATGGSGGSSGAGTGGAGGSGDGGTSLQGSFVVTFKTEPPPAFTQFIGRIYNGPQPPPPLKVDSEEGGCQLLVPKATFCEPRCMNGVCVEDNVCVSYPQPVGAGTARVSGFKTGDLTIEPMGMAQSYQPTMTLPPFACDDGAIVKVQTDKFTVETRCIGAFELNTAANEKIAVKTGQPVKLSWKAPAQTGVSRVDIHLDIAHHGGKKGEINCDVPDTGSFEIPAALTSKLISLGLAGFPTINVKRFSKASSPTEPGVLLQIEADIEREVDTGVVSCTDSSMCPPGQTCQVDLTCK